MTCLFCQIVAGNLGTPIVFENDHLLAFRDINPQAPVHILIIPKAHIASLNDVSADHHALMGQLMDAAKTIAKSKGFDENGYRVVINTLSDGGQTVPHLHVHLLAGRPMTWPPG